MITEPTPKRGCLMLVRPALTVLLLLIGIGVVAGLVVESAAEASDRQSYTAPGTFYGVDGHQMHIICVGESSPTVILEAGAGHFSATWAWVQANVAESTRVCAYDRAGYGWSESATAPRDAAHIAAELHTLLAMAGEEPPYVMVGHSVGGIYVRVFNAQYPDEVAGMVLVDATHPDNWERQGESTGTLGVMADVSKVIARFGLMRLFMSTQTFDLPTPYSDALKADMSSPTYWDTQSADIAAMDATLSEVRANEGLGNLPLAVLASVDYPEGKGRDTELALQAELAALSQNSTFTIIDGARHITLLTNPDYAAQVSEAIIGIVEAANASDG